MALKQIREGLTPGTAIFKPNGRSDVVVKGWGVRRGERALIFRIPGKRVGDRRFETGITESEWERAYRQLRRGSFTREWFDRNMRPCSQESGANFTTIGGALEFVGLASYERGAYWPRSATTRVGTSVAEVADLLI